jgi:LPS sulfotransferase NodH
VHGLDRRIIQIEDAPWLEQRQDHAAGTVSAEGVSMSALSARDFVIFATPRSGSSHLVSLLDSHPQIRCLGEIFNLKGGAMRALGLKPKEAVQQAGRDPLGYLNGLIGRSRAEIPAKPALGFKLMLHHDPRVIDHVLETPSWAVILLERRDRLAQWSSMKMAKTTGQWGARKGEAPKEAPKVTFSASQFDEYCFRMEARYASIAHRLGDRPVLRLYSEDIDDRHAELLGFLGVDASTANVLNSRQARQNTTELQDRIANFGAYLRYVNRQQRPPVFGGDAATASLAAAGAAAASDRVSSSHAAGASR